MERICLSASENMVRNSSIKPVKPGAVVTSKIQYRGIQGADFASAIALIWTSMGAETSREIYWMQFGKNHQYVRICSRAPNNSDGFILGLRVNTEVETASDIELLIEEFDNINVEVKDKTPFRYLFHSPFSLGKKRLNEYLPHIVIKNYDDSMIKLINYIAIMVQSRIFKNSYVFGYPFMAYVDPCNICNYHCPLCPTGRRDKSRTRSIMKLGDFMKIIDQIGPYLYSLHLYNWGEPLLNEELVDMIHYAKKFKIMVQVSTNLSILDENLARGLIKSGLDHLIISVDGITNDSYSMYRVGGDLQKVLNNIKTITATKMKLNSGRPVITGQFLVNRHNENEIPDVAEFFSKIGIPFSVGKIRLDMGDEVTKSRNDIEPLRDWLPIDPTLSAYDDDLNKPFSSTCSWPWTRICIDSEGSASACCALYSEKFDFGNVLECGFRKVWNGKKYRRARKIIRKHETSIDQNNPCNYCVRHNRFLDFQPKY